MIRILSGDITAFTGDVIVNAANNAGLGGGGVDGAIHRAAGPRLLEACKALPLYEGEKGLGIGMMPTNEVRVPTGYAVPTPATGTRLACKWVFHTAGPVWPENPQFHLSTTITLQNCFRRSLDLATIMGLKSIAFPAISTGVYGISMDICAHVALDITSILTTLHPSLDVSFYIFPDNGPNLAIWQEVARKGGLQFVSEPYQAQ